MRARNIFQAGKVKKEEGTTTNPPGNKTQVKN